MKLQRRRPRILDQSHHRPQAHHQANNLTITSGFKMVHHPLHVPGLSVNNTASFTNHPTAFRPTQDNTCTLNPHKPTPAQHHALLLPLRPLLPATSSKVNPFNQLTNLHQLMTTSPPHPAPGPRSLQRAGAHSPNTATTRSRARRRLSLLRTTRTGPLDVSPKSKPRFRS
jgi:hypothetical protein